MPQPTATPPTALAWRITWAAWLLLIPLTSWYGNAWLEGVRAVLDPSALTAMLALGIAAAVAYPLRQLAHDRTPDTLRRLATALVACAVVLAVIPAGPRWMHPLLFLPLGFLSLRCFGRRLGCALVVAVALGDETFQYVLPYRTGSPLDVAANALSGLAGAALVPSGTPGRAAFAEPSDDTQPEPMVSHPTEAQDEPAPRRSQRP